MISNKIYIDNFDVDYPLEDWGEVFETKEDFKRYSLQYFHRSDEYVYTDTTFTYDGVDYHLWRYTDIDSGAERVRYLLTTKTDFSGESVEDDITNDVCPYEYVLNENEEMEYDKNTRGRNFILVKQIIEGNDCDCCQGTYCDSLVTIEYLNQLASGHCITVGGIPYSDCCGEVSPSAYCPTQREIINQRTRITWGTHSEKDEHGFIMDFKSSSTQWPQSCCATVNQMVEGLGRMKKEVSFGYTEPYNYTHIIEKLPTCSDPKFEYKGHRTYKRYVVQCADDEECGGEGGVYTSPGEIAYGSDYTVEGTFEKVCTPNGNAVDISFELNPNITQNGHTQSCKVITSSTTEINITGACEMTHALESGCTEEIISSTTISAPPSYSYTLNAVCPTEIPCEGASIALKVVCDGCEDCSDVVVYPPETVEVPGGGAGNYNDTFTFSVNGCVGSVTVSIPYKNCGIKVLNDSICLQDRLKFYMGQIVNCDMVGIYIPLIKN